MKLHHPSHGIFHALIRRGRLLWDRTNRDEPRWWTVPDGVARELSIVQATERDRRLLASIGLFPGYWNPAELIRRDREATEQRRGQAEVEECHKQKGAASQTDAT